MVPNLRPPVSGLRVQREEAIVEIEATSRVAMHFVIVILPLLPAICSITFFFLFTTGKNMRLFQILQLYLEVI